MKFSRLALTAKPSGTLRPCAIVSAATVGKSLTPALRRACERLARAIRLIAIVAPATVGAVTISWDPNPETDIATYKVLYGTSSGSHPVTVNAGNTTSTPIPGLTEGTTYYFVVTAVNTAGIESPASAEVSYLVPVKTPTNQAPVATAASVSTQEDKAISFALSASDADSNPLTYSIVSHPAKGSLSGTPPNVTYTPSADANGSDSFTFKANDGKADSNTATVSISISAVNDAPLASNKSIATTADTAVAITLSASDKEGNPLTYSIVSPPSQGTLSGNAPNLTYTPTPGFSGADSFTYKAADAAADSNTATVSITVNPAPTGPNAGLIPQTGWSLHYVDSEEPNSTDAFFAFDGKTDTFWHTAWKTSGTLPPHEIQINLGADYTITGFRYLPRQDSLTIGNIGQYEFYTSMDGKKWGNPAATGTFLNTSEETEIAFSSRKARFIRLRALTEINNSSPTNVAELNILGKLFTNSPPAFKSKTVNGGAATAGKSYSKSITSFAADADSGDTLTFTKLAGPAWLTIKPNGKLTGKPPTSTTGINEFSVQVQDNNGETAQATLRIDVRAPKLPLPWDIGEIGSGIAAHAAYQSGTLELEASGRPTDSSDAGAFIWQMLSGDGQITTRVNSISDANENSRIGLMIRSSLAPNSKQVFIGLNGKGDIKWSRRTNTGGENHAKTVGNASAPKVWLKLVRNGDTIIASKSPDGEKWTRVGAITMDFAKNCYVGMVVSGGKGNASTATFRNVNVKP